MGFNGKRWLQRYRFRLLVSRNRGEDLISDRLAGGMLSRPFILNRNLRQEEPPFVPFGNNKAVLSDLNEMRVVDFF